MTEVCYFETLHHSFDAMIQQSNSYLLKGFDQCWILVKGFDKCFESLWKDSTSGLNVCEWLTKMTQWYLKFFDENTHKHLYQLFTINLTVLVDFEKTDFLLRIRIEQRFSNSVWRWLNDIWNFFDENTHKHLFQLFTINLTILVDFEKPTFCLGFLLNSVSAIAYEGDSMISETFLMKTLTNTYSNFSP